LASGPGLPSVDPMVIDDSVTVKEGDAIKILGDVGCDIADAVTDKVYAICVGFIVNFGKFNLPLRSVSDNSTYVDGTYTNAPTGDTYVAAADNTTDKQISALLMPVLSLIMSGYLDAAAETTTGSGKVGNYLDIVAGTASQLDESSVTTTVSNYAMLAGLSGSSSLDPADPAGRRVICRAIETGIGVG